MEEEMIRARRRLEGGGDWREWIVVRKLGHGSVLSGWRSVGVGGGYIKRYIEEEESGKTER